MLIKVTWQKIVHIMSHKEYLLEVYIWSVCLITIWVSILDILLLSFTYCSPFQMDLHEAQKGGGAPIGSPHEINNLKQQLQDTKKKLEAAEKQVDEKTKAVNELENKLKVRLQKNKLNLYLFRKDVDLYFLVSLSLQIFGNLFIFTWQTLRR